ncbi:MAG: VWA-like domain-containing protein [Negativicutes bacterium]
MEPFFDDQVKGLYESACNLINNYLKKHHKEDRSAKIHIPQDFKAAFFGLIDKVNLSLMEDKDNFYGYFLFQMSRDIRFDISSPTAVSFKGTSYVLSFNPVIFLTLTRKQMESTIKHEVLHICSMHLLRAKECRNKYKPVAINMAMDIVVNAYLDYLPPYATTLEWVNLNYSLRLLPFESFEYYVEKIQTALDLLEEVDDETEDDTPDGDNIETDYNPETTHDIWDDSGDIDEQTLREFTEKFIDASQKGSMPFYLASMLAALKSKADLPWNIYLKRFMGSVESDPKKTVTRRNRRQPDRLDLRGQLKGHKAKILVALDISGSISDEEFNQAIKEVFNIVKTYNHEITLVECDNEIRRVYQVKSAKDIKERIPMRGGTRFTPVFEYANAKKINLLVYFTDGKGEEKLQSIPRGYKTLWVVSGKGDKLSLKETYGVVKKLNPAETKEASFDMDNVEKGGYSMNNHEKLHI